MDLSFAVLDGILRAEGIIDLGIEPVRRHVSPDVSSSLLAVLLNSALIGGGVPLLIDMFKLDSPTGDWAVRTPTWARQPFSGTNDMISAALLGFVYLALTDSKSNQTSLVISTVEGLGLNKLSNSDVRTFCSLLLGSILLAEKATVLSLATNASPKPVASKTRSGQAAAAGNQNIQGNGAPNGSVKNRKQASRKQQ